jgi:hypothetical protein
MAEAMAEAQQVVSDDTTTSGAGIDEVGAA